MITDLHRYLDAAVLAPELTREETIRAIALCCDFSTATVCVRPCDLPLAREMTHGTTTGTCVVLGFPHGSQLSISKAEEARHYVSLGADEIDMVVNIGWVKSGLWDEVTADIAAVAGITRPANIPLKVIFETCLLTPEQITAATECAIRAGAAFVKTSTGFAGGGASPESVAIMVKAAGGRIQIKASGGIRTREEAGQYLAMGSHRLGVGYKSVPALCGNGEVSAPAGY